MALAGAILLLVTGRTLVILGYQARWGAALLAIFLVLAMPIIHPIWKLPMAAAAVEQASVLNNLGLWGAMLFILAKGSGAGSLDRRAKGT